MKKAWLVALGVLVAGIGCNGGPLRILGPRPFMSTVKSGVAVIHGHGASKAHGVIRFTQVGKTVKVVADMEGLPPNTTLAVHIHELGNCSDVANGSAAGHYTPHAHKEDKPHLESGHSGNLGNLKADANGKAHFEVSLINCSLAGVQRPIIGRSVIVDSEDGHKNSVGCGVIGIASVETPKK